MEKYLLIFYSDEIFFLILQTILTISFLWGLYDEYCRNKNKGGIGMYVTRGEGSRKVFTNVFVGVALIVITQLILSADFLNGYKVATITLDLIQVAYLCLYNTWFRNKIMNYYAKFQNKIDKAK
jgi:hypothetical protein